MADSRKKIGNLLVPAALFVAACFVYLPAVNGGFIWDDPLLIQNNVLLRDARGLWRIWSTITSIPYEDHYRPLQYTFLWVERRLWGDWTTGYHVVNMLLHGAIVVYIWRLMRRLDLPGAWLGAALFAVHPVHVEAVAWIISVKDLLPTLMFLIAVDLYLDDRERGGGMRMAATALVTAGIMLIKTNAVLLPAAFAILTWYRRGRIDRRDLARLAVLAAVTLPIAVFDVYAVKVNNAAAALAAPALPDRLLQAGMAFSGYWGKLVWPAGLSPIYPRFAYELGNPLDWLPLAAAGLVTAILWLTRDRIGRGPLACWLFYGVMLGPALGIVYFGFLTKTPIADRYQYLPSLGPIVGIGALAGGWIERARGPRTARLIPAIAILGVLAMMTWRQAGIYRSPTVFFARVMDIAPESSVPYYNFGVMACYQNRYEQAERMFGEAYRLDPGSNDAIYGLGQAMASQGKRREAVEFYTKAIDAGCIGPKVWANLAWLLATSPDPKIRNPKKALELATDCVARAPIMDAEYLNALAAAQAANGDTKSAAMTARAALELAKETDRFWFAAILEKAIPVYDQGRAYIE